MKQLQLVFKLASIVQNVSIVANVYILIRMKGDSHEI